jgi:hypothetical protein
MSIFDPQVIGPHWFWWLLAMACVTWYSTITVYVAIRGVVDIKQMLQRLAVVNKDQP